MNKPLLRGVNQAQDGIQERLSNYACALSYADLSPQAIHAAKVRIIDVLGALICGFFGEPCRIARKLAAQMHDAGGATVIGTRMTTTPDMAAYVNAITARYPELTDTYHWPGSSHGHASDTVAPVLAVAEHARISGREFITAVVLAYEVFLRISDAFHNTEGFDDTNFSTVATAVAAGKALRLSAAQLAHGIAMAVVPNNILAQVRSGHKSMFKTVAAGHAGRAGVFAALLARAGMEGPHLPFEGKAGWCDHVARERFSLGTMGGSNEPYKILHTRIKTRPANGGAIACILAAEKVAPLTNIKDVKRITLEVYKRAKDVLGAGDHSWNPQSREDADHSGPYVVAATLLDGTVTLNSFNDAHLWNPELRALMQKVELIENAEFTRVFERLPAAGSPVVQRMRITVETHSGERLVGETGGDHDDASASLSDAQIEQKFRGLTEDYLGAKRVTAVLDRLWHLDDVEDMAVIPPALVLC